MSAMIDIKFAARKGDFRLDVDTRVPAHGISGVFGESGAGKTSLLRCIAGLDVSNSADRRPVHERRIAYVFQQPQLFAHLSVKRNIEFGMRRNGASPVLFDEVVELLELQSLLNRSVTALSGGEAQRVAIARCLCQSPELILMDEPLASLDARRRSELLPFLERLHQQRATPVIYVSHDIEEISRLADHLLVIDRGRIVASGELQSVLSRLDLPQLSGQNSGVVIDAQPQRYDRQFDLTLFEFAGGELWVPGNHAGKPARLRIAANDVSLTRSRATESTILNILPATIEAAAAETAATQLIRLRLGDSRVLARITRRSFEQLGLQPGDAVFAQVKSVTVRGRNASSQGSSLALSEKN